MYKRHFIALVILLMCGCGESKTTSPTETTYTLPIVNPENCTNESVSKLPKKYIAEFSAMCLRQSNAKKSQNKAW